MRDNTFPTQKLRVREAVARFPVSRALAVETNAGMGTMTRFWASYCDAVVAIDKDARKLTMIDAPNVTPLCVHNMRDEAKAWWLASEIVDVDPHGDPWPILREIKAKMRVDRCFAAFTDGSWWTRAWSKDGRRPIEHKMRELAPADHHFERVERGGVLYYGWVYFEQ